MADELPEINLLMPLLSQRPIGIFSDIDGTLAPIVSRPDDARISPICRDLLLRLMSIGTRVVLVTGRTLGMARRITGLDDVTYAANHGLTTWSDGHEETSQAVEE